LLGTVDTILFLGWRRRRITSSTVVRRIGLASFPEKKKSQIKHSWNESRLFLLFTLSIESEVNGV
jgi:hypothetical protein